METAEHREPYESRGSRTDLGAPGGEIPPGDSTFQPILDERADDAQRDALFYILSGEDQPVGTCSRYSRPVSRPSRTPYSPRSSSSGTSTNGGRGLRLPT